ncbi:MAG TPA: GTP-binding protein [Salinivirgaceae bacterium]|nr:GTP-binding protein [Salinivirgaceae bacterium]
MAETQSIKETTGGYLDMELLRFTTAGSVDDGKSTLIGRLLYDSKAIFEDQLESIERASARMGGEEVNLALLTDGLRAEREQGITIDVAYRYFATPKRKFIIADTPGHIQYTRNMVTGASTANLALILVDARNGVLEQTRRHSYIASLLRIPHVVICVNKMDLVNYDQNVFENIKDDYLKNVAPKLEINDIRFVPISAKLGDNVVEKSQNMPWYTEQSLLHLLETIEIKGDRDFEDGRFPVQYVIRPISDKFHDYRGYAGRVAGGVFRPGDTVTAYPSGLTSRIKSIELADKKLEKAFPPMSIAMQLEDDIDISRGNMIVKNTTPRMEQTITSKICWLSTKPLILGQRYYLKHTTHDVRCIVTNINYILDINTLDKDYERKQIGLNDIAEIEFKTTEPLIFDSYSKNRITGSAIIIEEGSNNTVGACMLV